jgi:surface adhesion protein
MATEIGIVKTLIGTAIATAADGSQRTLQVGDRVFQDEVITTGAAGAIELEFTDGSVMTLGRSSQAVLDTEIFNPSEYAAAETPEAVADDVEALQQALLEGVDPTQIGEATAAGAGAEGADGNEGADIVIVSYGAPETTPEAGFDTTGISQSFDEPNPEDLPLETLSTAVSITNGDIDEDQEGILYTITLTNPGETDSVLVTNVGDIPLPAGVTEVTILVPTADPDVYVDPDAITVEVTDVVGGGFDSVDLSDASTTSQITDTIDVTGVSITAADVTENDTGVTFNIQLDNPPQGDASVDVTVGDQSFTVDLDENGFGQLFIETTDEDVYTDPDSLTATVTAINGGNFEETSTEGASTTAQIDDVVDITTVTVGTADVTENDTGVTFTFQLSNPPEGAASVDVTVGEQSFTVDVDENGFGELFIETQDEDVYVDPDSLSATVTAINGGNFEETDVTGASATAQVADVDDVTTVTVATSDVTENDTGVTFTFQLSNPPEGAASVSVDVDGTAFTVDVDETGFGQLVVDTNDEDVTFILIASLQRLLQSMAVTLKQLM